MSCIEALENRLPNPEEEFRDEVKNKKQKLKIWGYNSIEKAHDLHIQDLWINSKTTLQLKHC